MTKLRFLFALLILTTPALSQTSSGTITGRVFDPTGNSVPNAEVMLKNEGTRDARSTVTAIDGGFVFTSVQPAKFTLTVQAGGFKQYQQRGLVLSASERLSAGNIELTVGATSDSITVNAETTPVQTTSQERSALLNDKQVATLVTRGRDFVSLLRVLPGVVGGGGSETLGNLGTPTIQGVRSEYNSINLDGVASNPRGFGTIDTPVNLDAIAEVKVLQSNYQAEYGKSAGSVINAVTKSGTREFHGSGYYYKRHEQWNANDFFRNRNGLGIARYRYSTIGYNVGGPVYIPNKFNTEKNKLFFFFSQEILPNKRPSSLRTYTVPTALERQGNFSQTLEVNNVLIPIKDPVSGVNFPGNIIPASRINADTQKILNIFPAPNFLDRVTSGGRYNFITSDIVDNPVRQEILRVDYNINSKLRAYFRGTNMSVKQSGVSTPASPVQWAPYQVAYDTTNPNVGGNLTYTISPTLVNEFTMGTARWSEDQRFVDPADALKLQRKALGINIGQFHPENNPLNLVPGVSFGGVQSPPGIGFDGRFPMNNIVWSTSFSDGLSKIHKKHIMKFGIDVELGEYLQPHHSGSAQFAGTFDFGKNTNNPFDSNYAYSNALLGNFNSYAEASSRIDYQPYNKLVEWYAQDNWHVAKRLTLDYGMRFTYAMNQVWTKDVASNLYFNKYDFSKVPALYQPAKNAQGVRVAQNPVNGELLPAVFIGAFVPNSGNVANGVITAGTNGYPRSLSESPGLIFAPRLGFAYDVFGDGKTAIRGGVGVYYNTRSRSGLAGDMAFNPPQIFNPTQYYGNVQSFLNTAGVLFPSSMQRVLEPSPKMVTSYNMNFGIQRNIGFGTVLDVAYVNTLGRHLGQSRNLNLVPYGSRFLTQNFDSTTNTVLPDNFFRPYPGWANLPYTEFASTSSYHSLQVQANRRFSHGLQFGSVWTWSKAMDFTDAFDGGVAVYAPLRVWNYGKAGFDRTHIVTLNWLYDIPKATKLVKSSVVGFVLDNWQLAGIATFASGAPTGIGLNTTDGADITGGGDGARVVVLQNPALPKDQRTFDRWFDPAVFARPARGTVGNAPKDVFRGPGSNGFDLSFFKNFPIRERIGFQFRAEMYNAFNHTQFTGVDTAARFDATGKQVSATLGQVTSTASPRIMQFALRFSF